MDTLKYKKDKTLTIAHRGVSGLETENTCAAFIAAGNRSYYGIETDVHVTKDNKYYVIHDSNTERVCKDSFIIEESVHQDIEKLILNDIDNKNIRRDLTIPSFENYLNICKKYNKIAIIELKNEMQENNIDEIIKIVENNNYLQNSIIISFWIKNILYVRKRYQKLKIQYLVDNKENINIDSLIKNKFDIDIYYKILTKEMVETFHKNNIKVNCWTVNNVDDAEVLSSWNVDFITTNILE